MSALETPLQRTGARAVCVLGMHRSGTSLTARLLNLLGVDLGPTDALLPANDNDNATGFWEHEPLTRLNDEILAALGGNWREPPVSSPGWTTVPAVERLRPKARRVLHAAFAGAPLYGWKDPRTSLTLPFWRELVPRPLCVVCVRNPVDVASSLARRDRMAPADSHAAWLSYNASLLVASAGLPRLIVDADRVVDELDNELGRMAAFIGRPQSADDPAVRAAAEAFVDPALWHRQDPGGGDDGSLPRTIRALYDGLRAAAASSPSAAPASDTCDLDALAPLCAELGVELRRSRAQARLLGAAERDLAHLEERLALTEEARRQTAAYAEQAHALRTGLERELTKTRAALTACQADASALRRRTAVRAADWVLPVQSRRRALYGRLRRAQRGQ